MMRIKVVDVETTGLAPPEAAVVEVAFCNLQNDGDGWYVAGGAGILVDPGCPIPPEASAIHHIIDDDVRGQPSLAEAWQAITSDVTDEVVALACHNSRFDRQFLTDDLVGEQRWIDTYRCALRLWPQAPLHSNGVLRYWLKPEGLDRSEAAAHRAYGDAYVTAHILREMLAITSGKQLVAWSTGPALLPRFTFGKHAMKPIAEIDLGYFEWILGQDFDEDVLFTARAEIERRKRLD